MSIYGPVRRSARRDAAGFGGGFMTLGSRARALMLPLAVGLILSACGKTAAPAYTTA